MHICHIVYRFDIGGLENGIINILNQLPSSEYRHTLICLSDYNPDFYARITAKNVAILALNKQPGKDLGYLRRLFSLLKQHCPDVVHTRNLNTLECQAIAWSAGIPVRIHGEHGWDSQQAMNRRKPILLRKIFSPLISRYVALSAETEHYLADKVGIAPSRIERICNGVDTDRFKPMSAPVTSAEKTLVIGSVGRLATVKNHQLLIKAFARLTSSYQVDHCPLRLLIAGEGPCRQPLTELIAALKLDDRVSLLGACQDVPRVMSGMDLYVQPSVAEGISNTILEAMACRLPVVTTDVGGARELVRAGYNGQLTNNDHLEQLTEALQEYIDNPQLILEHGTNSRTLAEQEFSIDKMASRYHQLYQNLASHLSSRP